ncbi:MAG TPA: nucleotidyltransferase family protein [Candidatus Competibacter sp.]|nr:nucleotidyltransferase family protein [Candidatus Competibacter sp.]
MKQGILLAAGFSRRFGANKLLQPLTDGVPVALAAARRLRAALPEVLAVVNSGDPALGRLLDEDGFSITVCSRAEDGMGASLAWAVEQTAQASAWIVALADMPSIRPETIVQVADAIERPIALAAPVFHGRRGHPVGFGRAYFEQLIRLTGDEGARSILRDHAEQVRWLVCEDPGVIADIDTPADLQSATLRPSAAPGVER